MSGDESEPDRHFDTQGRVDQEHLGAVMRATPVEARPLLDLEKLRASFEFGLSPREPTAVVSPVRYAQSLLRRIEQLVGELKEIVEARRGRSGRHRAYPNHRRTASCHSFTARPTTRSSGLNEAQKR